LIGVELNKLETDDQLKKNTQIKREWTLNFKNKSVCC
jgi:hypothetical protein